METSVTLARRKLGRTGLMISEIGFGSWGIGGKIWRDSDDRTSLDALARAFELGINFVDTALIYGGGHSEQLVGKALKGRGDSVYVATKMPPGNMIWPPRPGIPFRDAFPLRHVKKCTDGSLRNLQRQTLDLQQFHIWNPEWASEEDFREAIDWLKCSGKARFVGISTNDHQPNSVISALRTDLVDCVQVIYNIFDPSPADDLFPLCQELDVGVIARVPFDEGSLTGAITAETSFDPGDWRSRYFSGDRKREVTERVRAIKNALGGNVPLAETSLRFCLSHPAVSTVIAGMRKTVHVEENVLAASNGPLSSPTLQVLTSHRWPRNFYN
jgi:aryl-alcohol dehydrogenase-like predicted oxidoreductase